jgi:hypothetical protein
MNRSEWIIQRYENARERMTQKNISIPPDVLTAYTQEMRAIRRERSGEWFSMTIVVTRDADPALIAMLASKDVEIRPTAELVIR